MTSSLFRRSVFLVSSAAAMFLASLAQGQGSPPSVALFGVDMSIAGDPLLVSVDPATGVSTFLAPLAQEISDLAYNPVTDELYGTGLAVGGVARLDPATGDFLLIGPSPTPIPLLQAIAVDPVTGTIYASGLTGLYAVDPSTGIATFIGGGAAGLFFPFFASLAFDAASGELYGIERVLSGVFGAFQSNLYRIDPGTAAAVFVASVSEIIGLDFDAGGLLYGSSTGDTLAPPTIGPSSLSLIDPTTGDITGTIPSDADNLLAIAFTGATTSTDDFARGDVNGDGLFDIADAVSMLASLFIPGSAALGCADAADGNDDGTANIADAVGILTALFVFGSPPPSAPSFPDCGPDPTADPLDCTTPTCP
ncbi:MAG: hypothetical protein ACKVX7_08485 [Planctomycetota bacterium]